MTALNATYPCAAVVIVTVQLSWIALDASGVHLVVLNATYPCAAVVIVTVLNVTAVYATVVPSCITIVLVM
jgi:hypothetical protein